MNRLLVDTHVVLWWLDDSDALSPGAREILADPTRELLVSTASLWEIGIKCSLGKLEVAADLPTTIAGEGFTWLPVTAAHAWAVRGLRMHHRDPFDRLLIAQSLVEGIPVVTADSRFSAYGVDARW